MLDPAELPAELFCMVVDFIVENKEDQRPLCILSLVSHHWHAIHTPRLYSKFTHDGDTHSFMSLWKFLRTMLENERLVQYVRALDIQYWGLHLNSSDNDGPLMEEDIVAIHDAVRMAGMQKLAPDIEEAILQNDRRPLMALLLTVLPNVISLHAQIPEKDPYLAEVLRLSVDHEESKPQRKALQNLESAQLMSEWHVRHSTIREPRDNYLLELQHTWPIFRLPSLREVSVFDFDPRDASVYFDHYARTSSITHMTLVIHKDVSISARDAHVLLTLPRALISLSIYINDCYLFPERQTMQLSNEELWLGVESHCDSIEHFDFYRDCTGVRPPMHREGNGHFGSLGMFTRLNRLCVQPETLLGGCTEDDPLAPFRLKDTLPSTLKSLTFYGDQGLLRNEHLGDQICEILEVSSSTQLASIFLEDVSATNAWFTHPKVLPYRQVRQACRKRGITYRRVKGKDSWTGHQKAKRKTLLKGGSKLPCAKNAFSTRCERRDKFEREEELKRAAEQIRRREAYLSRETEDYEGLESELFDSDDLSLDALDSRELDTDLYDTDSEFSDCIEALDADSEETELESVEPSTSGSDVSNTDEDNVSP
jgi:hypothetical protein